LIFIFLGVGCLHDKHRIVGLKNVHEFLKLVDSCPEKTGTMMADHKGFADIFVIQVLLAVKGGLWNLVLNRILPLIGSVYVECSPFESLILRASPRVATVPPKLANQENLTSEQIRAAARINKVAKKDFVQKLLEGYVGMMFAEGTRSRSGKMLRASRGVVDYLGKDWVILPLAIEGTEKILPPAKEGSFPFPNLWQPVTIIVGKPIFKDECVKMASFYREHFDTLVNGKIERLSLDQATIDIVYRQIALLHIEKGNPEYSGYYSRPLEEIYIPRKK
jgi:hypothetical protein